MLSSTTVASGSRPSAARLTSAPWPASAARAPASEAARRGRPGGVITSPPCRPLVVWSSHSGPAAEQGHPLTLC
ncbi:MAG: hypothetical protein ACRDOH_16560, partial [Streptosporangiaceae bacterium]